jgi:cytochrome c oxidase assembly protein subunit 11
MASPTVRKIGMAVGLLAVVGGMLGLSFASVPLYRLFCQVTGYGGTPKTTGVAAPSAISERMITVQFDANVNSTLPWQFEPGERQVRIRLGEERLVHYVARNRADHPVIGTATFNVVPETAARYFSKIQCFCFEKQTLAAGQEVSMPVLFYVDPALAEDPETRNVRTITLSYTFFPVEGAPSVAEKPDRRVGDGG